MLDDLLAVARPWGFDPATVTVPVGIWHGKHDARVSPAHTDWLVDTIPRAHRHVHDGGHAPTAQLHREMLSWLKN